MSELFKDIPEFVEVSESKISCMRDTYAQTSIGESVTARTETLGMCTPLYLGLDDLV